MSLQAASTGPAGQGLNWCLPPGLPGPRQRAWLQACERHLQQLCEQAAAGPLGSAGAQRAVALLQAQELQLGAVVPRRSPRAWWLTDRQGRALDLRAPLLAEASAGEGLALALWGAAPGGWVCLQRAHWACGPRWADVQALLPQALAWLLWQAALAAQLAEASGSSPDAAVQAGPGPAAEADEPPLAGKALPAAPLAPEQPAQAALPALKLRGWLRAWRQRQQARWCREQWRLGVLDCGPAQLLQPGALPAPRWLPAYPGLGYWADPAAQAGPAGDSDSRILAEFFDEAQGQGHIEELQLDPGGHVLQRNRMPLGGGRHASFAHVVRAGGRQLGLAETAALRGCELFEVDASGRWQPLATVLQGLALADPTLFHWQGRWWLAATDLALGGFDNLCLFHAEQPEGPWQPHLNNPVRRDLRGARMGGAFFWHEGRLYRPAQDCAAHYGAALALYQVQHCSPAHYQERLVRRLLPDPQGPCPEGVHTLNVWGGRLLVDGKRHVFSPALAWLKLRRRLGLARARA